MRYLASVQKVWDILSIEGADAIELVKVLGWQCVAKKGEFHKGDLGVYFEIDSFLPVRPEFEFLRANCYKKTDIMGEGFKLRTMKFKGQVSQGLILPLDTFGDLLSGATVGTDATELLGVKKWEIEETATTGGTVIGVLPHDVPHTDETRVQSMPELIQEFGKMPYYITTKMDGSSHSLNIDEDGKFHVCGHNYEYKDDGTSSFYEFVKQKNFEKKMRECMETNRYKTLTVQGEFCAPGIQRNRLKLTRPEWYVFTIRINGERVNMWTLISTADEIGAEIVPIEETGTDLADAYPTVDALLQRADGEYPNGGKKEGIVIRTVTPVYSELIGGPLSMKVINNKYLLKNND